MHYRIAHFRNKRSVEIVFSRIPSGPFGMTSDDAESSAQARLHRDKPEGELNRRIFVTSGGGGWPPRTVLPCFHSFAHTRTSRVAKARFHLS